jgi:hypothetical protein
MVCWGIKRVGCDYHRMSGGYIGIAQTEKKMALGSGVNDLL